MSDCSVNGCSHPSEANGLCKKHYQRVRRNGTPHNLPYHRNFRTEGLTPLGRNIHGRRVQMGLKVQNLCEEALISTSQLRAVCEGRGTCTIKLLDRLAGILQCEAWQFLKPGTFSDALD